MDQACFAAYAQIVQQAFGIQLPPEKKALLESRLFKLFQRMRTRDSRRPAARRQASSRGSGRIRRVARGNSSPRRSRRIIRISCAKRTISGISATSSCRGSRRQRQAVEALRQSIVFRPFNLLTHVFPFRKPFHVIFCRNVMIYFDWETRTELVRKFYDWLVPALSRRARECRAPRGRRCPRAAPCRGIR